MGLANGRNAYGGGNQDIRSFEPFPWGIGFDKGKGKKSSQDIDLLLEVIDCIPSVKDMQVLTTLVPLSC